MRHIAVISGMLAALALGRAASAQTACASGARVERLEAEGMRLNQSGDHESARQRFEQAYALCQGARAQARMAITLMALERWSEADRWMRQALARGDDAWVAANRVRLDAQLAVINEHLGGQPATTRVPLSGDPEGAAAAAREPAMVPQPVLRAPTPERAALEMPRAVDGGARDASIRRRVHLVLGGVSAGLAVVAAGVGVWATLERFSRYDEYSAHCPEGQWRSFRADSECDESSPRFTRVSDASVVVPQVAGFVAASVFAVTSVVLFATAPGAQPAHAFACGPGPGSVGIGCQARF